MNPRRPKDRTPTCLPAPIARHGNCGSSFRLAERLFAKARQAELKGYFRPDHRAIASINSPVQGMMKEICAQFLQRHRDPVTGTETVVFSCFNQNQKMDRVDFRILCRRLSQKGRPGKTDQALGRRCLQHPGERPAMAAGGRAV